MKNIRNSLPFDNIVLDGAGYIELTGLQYNILFTEDNKAPFPVTTTKVPLLRVAGEAALYKNSPNSFMKQLVSRLLPDLQKMATLHGQTEARQYHEAELVKLLHQEVILETNSSEIRGVLKDAGRNGMSQKTCTTSRFRVINHTKLPSTFAHSAVELLKCGSRRRQTFRFIRMQG
jgi:hypothetical protein